MERRAYAGALALALVFEAVLAIVDASAGREAVLTGAYVLGPVALALTGRPRPTALVGAVAIACAIASGWWNDYAGSTNHLLRVGTVALGSVLATLAAGALGRAATDRAHMRLLAAVGRLSGTADQQEALNGIREALVPAAAEDIWIDAPERLLATTTLTETLDQASTEILDQGQARLIAPRAAAIPLKTGSDTFGVLGLIGRDYTEDDLAFFDVLAGRVSLVLTNVRLLTDLRSARARLDGILGSLAEAVTVHGEDNQTIYANEAAARLLGRSSAEDVTRAKPGELASRFTMTKEDGTPVALEELPGRRLVKGEPGPALLTRSVDKVTGRAYWLLTKASAFEDNGRTYAVNIMEDVTQAKEAELRQRFLARSGQLLASSLDYAATLKRVAELAVPWLADWCAVDLPGEHGEIVQVALAHSDPEQLKMAEAFRRRFPPDPDSPRGVAAVLKGGPAQLFASVPERLLDQVSNPERRAAMKEIGIRAAMIVPMRVGDETLGAITLVSADSGRTFDEDAFIFAQDVALRAATAVQNARLYAEQARVAHTLQASLLPERLPSAPGWEAAAAYQAGEHGSDVGGDFYDIVPAAGGGRLVFLGDVTGKGIAAAALTSLVRHSVRTAARFDPRPAAILRLANDVLLELPRLSPVTLVCALIEGTKLTVAAGGHPRPLLKRGGTVTEIGRHGTLLGALDDFEADEDTLELAPGDTLVLYTDGVTDTPGESDRFGHERLIELLRGAPPEPEAILRRIEDALGAFQASSAADDRALLVLRYVGDQTPALKLSPSTPISRMS